MEDITLWADRFAVDQDRLRIGFTVLFDDGNELPFSVQPEILIKVDRMFVVVFHVALNPSRCQAGEEIFGRIVRASVKSGSSRLDSKLDSKVDLSM